MNPALAIAADLCLDLVFTGDVTPSFGQVEKFVDDYQVELGGSAAIFSSQFTKLGGIVSFTGVIGNDAFGSLVRDKLLETGISPDRLLQTDKTKTAVGLGLARGEDRAMLTYKGTMELLTMDVVRESGMLENASHIHIASYYLLGQLHDFWESRLPAYKRTGKTLSLDTNWAPEENWEKVHGLLPLVDVFLPNEEEAKHISGQETVEEAGNWLCERSPLVIVKRGSLGASVFQAGKKVVHYPVSPKLLDGMTIADTTGAGDNFSAGFIFNWLKGKSIFECVSLAETCATSSLREVGGIAGQYVPDREHL